MTFSNPVSLSTATTGLDYAWWACVATDTNPPTLLTGAGYGVDIYTYVGGYSANMQNLVTWPSLAAANPRTGNNSGYTLTGRIKAYQTGYATVSVTFNTGNGSFTYGFASGTASLTCIGNGGNTSSAINLAANDQTWKAFTLQVASDGSCTLTYAGQTIQSGGSPTAPNHAFQMILAMPAHVNTFVYLSSLRLTWA